MTEPITVKKSIKNKVKNSVERRTSAVTGVVLKHAVGAGKKCNHVPEINPEFDAAPRTIEIGWHPLGGSAGKWIAERTKLGRIIKAKINELPDPSQHWAVIVGDYAHQLWIDENFHVMYTNDCIKRDEWRTLPVGETTFNDEAIRQAGESVIADIQKRQPVYNIITNNCQTYALQLTDLIQAEKNMELVTTLALFKKLRSMRKVFLTDLFSDFSQDEKKPRRPQLAPITMEIRDDDISPLDALEPRADRLTTAEAKNARESKDLGRSWYDDIHDTALGPELRR